MELTDCDRLNWLQQKMKPKDDYCEIYFAGLRNGNDDATAYQVEASPEKFKVQNAPTLREAIDKAIMVEKLNDLFPKRSQCHCSCHSGGIVHMMACCVPD
jgi:hypothetical protein